MLNILIINYVTQFLIVVILERVEIWKRFIFNTAVFFFFFLLSHNLMATGDGAVVVFNRPGVAGAV